MVCLAGTLPGQLLTELGRPVNVSVIRPPQDAGAGLDAAARSLAGARPVEVSEILAEIDEA